MQNDSHVNMISLIKNKFFKISFINRKYKTDKCKVKKNLLFISNNLSKLKSLGHHAGAHGLQ